VLQRRSRILLQRVIADESIASLIAKSSAVGVGDPLDPETKVGPIVGADRPASQLGGPGCRRDASDRGCAPDVRRIPPTVDGQVDLSMPIASDEVFGPVVTVMTFETLNEAVDLANATSYGLSASVWTCDVDTAVGVGRGVGAGTIWGNTFMDGTPEPPFGGYGQSGLGRELGHSAVAGYTGEKTFHVHKDPRMSWWLPRT
jgi:betaine-aldehyde dehydrogenase